MLHDLSQAAAEVGLKLYMGKTKILSNVEVRNGNLAQPRVQVGTDYLEVIPYDAIITYLGRAVSFHGFHDTEINNRISRGWAAFAKFRDVLYCRHYAIRSRLRLFESVINPVVLCAPGCWTMTATREHVLSTKRLISLNMNLEGHATDSTAMLLRSVSYFRI